MTIEQYLQKIDPFMPPTTCVGFAQLNDSARLFLHFKNGEKEDMEIHSGTVRECRLYLDAMYKALSLNELARKANERISQG
jgi:hypothetical protein